MTDRPSYTSAKGGAPADQQRAEEHQRSSTSSGQGRRSSGSHPEQVLAMRFFGEYHGHTIRDLQKVHTELRKGGKSSFIWLCGDSSLDNKHWLYEGGKDNLQSFYKDRSTGDACNGYEHFLSPPRCIKDIAYFLNKEIINAGLPNTACINCSIEESTVGARDNGHLFKQDQFLRDHLAKDDIIICSVGGNDIALRPSLGTIFNILVALVTASTFGTGSSGYAPGLGHFVNLFGSKIKQYLEGLIAKTKPKAIAVCMIYYLDANPNVESWANVTLSYLRYNSQPQILQGFINYVYENATSKIEIEGVQIIPIPLFKFLDGTDSRDYIARVEPSVRGGEKMAAGIWNYLQQGLQKAQQPSNL